MSIQCDKINCPLNQQLTRLCSDMSDVKLALCGNEKLGVPGVVKQVNDLQRWRNKITLRVVSIGSLFGGGAAFFADAVKSFFDGK